MKILDFLGNIFSKKSSRGTNYFNFETYRAAESTFQLQLFAIACVADLIATLVSKSTFEMYGSDEKPERSEMW